MFSNLEVIDAGAKGKTIAKAPDGKVVFLPNAVPGDIVDVQTFKQRKGYYEGKATFFINYQINVHKQLVSILGLVGAVNGNTWTIRTNFFTKKKKWLITLLELDILNCRKSLLF